jgi:hypothetical protein
MTAAIVDKKAVIYIRSEKITSLITATDDLLMNARIAEEIIEERGLNEL